LVIYLDFYTVSLLFLFMFLTHRKLILLTTP
jgi:hypothetical protein